MIDTAGLTAGSHISHLISPACSYLGGGEGKVVPVLNLLSTIPLICMGGCIVPCYLDLSTTWTGVVSFMPGPLNSRRKPLYPLHRRLGGPQSRSGRCGGDKILDPTGTRNSRLLGRPARSQSLYRLRYPDSTLL
jgi:hypothetical protein